MSRRSNEKEQQEEWQRVGIHFAARCLVSAYSKVRGTKSILDLLSLLEMDVTVSALGSHAFRLKENGIQAA